ncbi:hypothetical protein HMF3257_05055 [Spirosoma telluris]|uniref:Uncharacterized protein n=1 Tax=Spirosoma telluris TaxID=2183553 RepID=A0A327NGH4_9BACT|nr:hypothetical protein HMF3257_05055 [Spirosoma telluris]
MVEFDEVHNANDKSFHFRIKKSCTKLKKAGYVLVHSTHNLKRTFIREDVYNSLKSRSYISSDLLSQNQYKADSMAIR